MLYFVAGCKVWHTLCRTLWQALRRRVHPARMYVTLAREGNFYYVRMSYRESTKYEQTSPKIPNNYYYVALIVKSSTVGGSSWTSARASFETNNNRGLSWAELQLEPHFKIILIISRLELSWTLARDTNKKRQKISRFSKRENLEIYCSVRQNVNLQKRKSQD